MKTKYKPLMKKLWNLSGEIGVIGEESEAYARVYAKLSEALDEAEAWRLIETTEDEELE